MPKGKLKLKWRLVKGEWRAGPFIIHDYGPVLDKTRVSMSTGPLNDVRNFGAYVRTVDEAKRACEKLASRIFGAMK